MGWSTMASWCPKDSTVGEAMGAQVKIGNVTNIKSGLVNKKEFGVGFQCRDHCSVPLGSGERAWFRLHSHLPRLVKEIHQMLHKIAGITDAMLAGMTVRRSGRRICFQLSTPA